MMRRAAVLALVAFAGCGRDKAPEGAPAASATPAASPNAGGGAAANDCPRTGHWIPCQLKKRLESAGLAPRDTAALSDLPELGVKPTLLMLGNAGLAYYLFPDSTARHQAAARLDTARFISQARPLSMHNEVTRIENDNALALLFSRNEHQRERVSDAITAGPPQP